MLVFLTALVVAATLGTTTAAEDIPWINVVPLREVIPFDENSGNGIALELKASWGADIAADKYVFFNIKFKDSDGNTKIGFGYRNRDGKQIWALTPCYRTSDNWIPLPENFIYSEGESIWTLWKEDGKLNILYNGEDFLRDGYPGETEGLDCTNPTVYPNGKADWVPAWEAELKSVEFSAMNTGKTLGGYRFIPIPVDGEPGKNEYL